MGFTTLNVGNFGVQVQLQPHRLLNRTSGGLRRLVAILVAHPGYDAAHTGDGLQRASRAGSLAGDRPGVSVRLAARGFDEPASCAFLGANWLRTLEVVLP